MSTNLPSHTHHVALFEARRAQLERQAELAILTGRINALCRKAAGILIDVDVYAIEPELAPTGPVVTTSRASLIARIGHRAFSRAYRTRRMERLADAEIARQNALDGDTGPVMRWVDGIRTQPRDGRGRFLSRAWLAGAELYLPTDRAWFRHPITEEQ